MLRNTCSDFRLASYAREAVGRIVLEDLQGVRPLPSQGGQARQVSGGWALLHALEHTGLHLGHAQLTRQLWEQR